MAPDGPKKARVAPGGPKRARTAPGGPRKDGYGNESTGIGI